MEKFKVSLTFTFESENSNDKIKAALEQALAACDNEISKHLELPLGEIMFSSRFDPTIVGKLEIKKEDNGESNERLDALAAWLLG